MVNIRKNVQFDKIGHDEFIDFLKGFCILSVVLAHCMPAQDKLLFCLWGGMQIPLFLLIQVFHAFKKEECYSIKQKLWPMVKRIVLPFLFVVAVGATLKCLLYGPDNMPQQLLKIIKAGGVGPGSYYMWIYLQFFFILPILFPLIRKMDDRIPNVFTGGGKCLIFITLCESLEQFCIAISMPEWIYRLLMIRYVMLIWLGYEWVKQGITLNKKTIILSLLSVIAVLWLKYSDANPEPFLFDTGWKVHHWICYFYPAYLLVYFLHQAYIKCCTKIKQLFCRYGKCSYEIYLWQMLVFAFYPSNILRSYILSSTVYNLSFFCIATILSICPVLIVKSFKLENKQKKKVSMDGEFDC